LNSIARRWPTGQAAPLPRCVSARVKARLDAKLGAVSGKSTIVEAIRYALSR
jgi:hypothetical protein